jgi:hypothetical protein
LRHIYDAISNGITYLRAGNYHYSKRRGPHAKRFDIDCDRGIDRDSFSGVILATGGVNQGSIIFQKGGDRAGIGTNVRMEMSWCVPRA